MICLALALLAGPGKLDVETVPPIEPGLVSVEALVRLPKTGPYDRAVLDVLAATLLDDTTNDNRQTLLEFTADSGDAIHVALLPDCVRVRFSVTEPNAAAAPDILAQVLHASEFTDDDLAKALADLPFRHFAYWRQALEPERLAYRDIARQDVLDAYGRIFRPENFCVTFAADPAAGDLEANWRSRVAGWTLPEPAPYAPDRTPPRLASERGGELTTVLLRGRPFEPGADFPTRLLAMLALGGGKGSAIWKAVREGQGWSYRQEALLRNSPDGLEPCFVAVTRRSPEDADHAKSFLPALLRAVAAWGESDRRHALGVGRSILDRGVGLDPLYFKSWAPATGDPLFLRTYWRMKTGADWNTPAVEAAMARVSSADLKAEALRLLDGCEVELIRGTG